MRGGRTDRTRQAPVNPMAGKPETKNVTGVGPKVGHRGRMRDHAVILYKLLREYRRISIGRIAEEMEISEPTARRWVNSFSCVFPIRMENGIVIVDKGLK